MRRRIGTLVVSLALLAVAGGVQALADDRPAPAKSTSEAPAVPASWQDVPLPAAVQKGIKWLVLAQDADGGWSQEGARTRGNPSVQSPKWNVSNVGDTSFAALALLASGSTPARGTFQGPLQRAVDYILRQVEVSPDAGLAITPREGTQIQGKIGRYADTFLAARVLLEVDGHMHDDRAAKRVSKALRRVLAKIEQGQAADGSWHVGQSWAPIHSTAYASQALWIAKTKGHAVRADVLARVERFTLRQLKDQARSAASAKAAKAPKVKRRRGRPPVVTPSGGPTVPDLGGITVGSAGVVLYSLSQGIELLSRTPASRKRFAPQIKQITEKVQNKNIIKGLGSMGGEEYISYANINLAFARMGGDVPKRWIRRMADRLGTLQNRDGSWSGHHCITGRTAVTSLAVLSLTAERQVPRRID